MRRFALRSVALAAACMFFVCCACAETLFQGVVTCEESAMVNPPYGGMIDSMSVKAGDRIEKGQKVAVMRTSKVYADCEGTISGIFGIEGDSTESVIGRYGAVMYIEPLNKYTISATTEKAYNASENKFVHIGETVYLKCTADGGHKGAGIVTGFGEDGKSYKVEVNAGEFCMEETVGIYRKKDYAASSCIGRGTVAATSPVAVKGTGSILKMHVKNGDYVEKGELVFETVDGVLDGFFSPGSDVISEYSGIVAEVNAAAGASVEKDGKVLTVYPDDSLVASVPVKESDLCLIWVGQKMKVEFNWDPEQLKVFDGEVAAISYISSAESGDPVYTAIVRFTPDETVRMGMTVLVYAAE